MNPDRICYGCFQEKGEGPVCPHCGFDLRATQPYLALPLGTILNGRYMTGKVLGMGGFGITYLGFDLTLQIQVAIKEYMPASIATRHADRYGVTLSGLSEQDYRYGMERFLDEARILAKLQNTPNIVSVQNYFKENNTAYFVMEYVDGMSLKAYLDDQGGKIPYTQALTILQPIMEALSQVHAMNLLHRDISPDNIFITTRGESRLLDFGAARFALGDEKSVSVILKHGYAPEEQYSSHGNQGPWTDVYAMGATLYRCITGALPPDSVERLRQDTLKMPSELGIHVPKYVEQALKKALAIYAADRFANMETFIEALNGRPSVQERVAAGVSERTQAARNQTVYHGGGRAPSSVPGGILRLWAYLKANPVVAWVSGGCLALVVALCIILPLALSNQHEDYGPAGSAGEGITPVAGTTLPPTTDLPAVQPTIAPSAPQTEIAAPVGSIRRDLGALNASLTMPNTYTPSEDGFSFIDQQNNRVVESSFMWNIGVPIYSLADVEDNQMLLVEQITNQIGNVQNYEVRGSAASQINGLDAFLLAFEATDASGVVLNVTIVAIDGQAGYGCYLLLGAWRASDTAGGEEVATILDSFQRNGPVDTSYAMWYGEDSAVKVIVDDSITQGRVYDMAIPLEDGSTIYALYLYPSDKAEEAGSGNLSVEGAGNVEIGAAAHYGAETPEEMLDFTLSLAQLMDGEASDQYSLDMGGLEWLCQDYAVGDYIFSYAAAMIDDACYMVGCMYDDSTEDAVLALYQQALSSVRPWEG